MEQSNLRSNNLNKYYWKIIIPVVTQGLHDNGYQLNEIDRNTVHEFLKEKFCPEVEEQDRLIKSTSKLSNKLFKEYFLYIQIWATTYLGIYIPDPNETL